MKSQLRFIFMNKELSYVTIYVATGQPEAYIIKGRLENEGIPVLLRYESVGAVYGLTLDGLGQVEIQVPFSLVETARQILTDQEDENSNSSLPDQESN
jgi:hypothetical protein